MDDESCDEESFIAPSSEDEEISSEEEEDSLPALPSVFPPESAFDRNQGTIQGLLFAARESGTMFCFMCDMKRPPDSFSIVQKKEVDDIKRFCLNHTSTSSFNQPAWYSPPKN